MKLTFNPFKLRRLARHYARLCSKQCLALIDCNDQIAELVAENHQQQKQIHFLQTELKIAQDRIKADELVAVWVKQGDKNGKK